MAVVNGKSVGGRKLMRLVLDPEFNGKSLAKGEKYWEKVVIGLKWQVVGVGFGIGNR